MSRTVMVTGTRRRDGKTAVTIGLTAALRKRTPRVGFIKPLGLSDITTGSFRLDRDAVLIEKALSVPCSIQDMSPVTLDQATVMDLWKLGSQEYEAKGREMRDQIREAFAAVSRDKDVVVVEGTGHAMVGSVFGLGNADLARELGAKVIIVVSGGIGQPMDEIAANVELFKAHGVEIAGAVINRVFPHERPILEKFGRRILDGLHVPLLGLIPRIELLDAPTIRDAAERVGGEAVSGKGHLSNAFTWVTLAAANVDIMLTRLKPASLLIASGDRSDLVLAAINAHRDDPELKGCLAGILLTNGVRPAKQIARLIEKSDVPCVVVEQDTYSTALEIGRLETDINPSDQRKIETCIKLVAEHVDVDAIMSGLDA